MNLFVYSNNFTYMLNRLGKERKRYRKVALYNMGSNHFSNNCKANNTKHKVISLVSIDKKQKLVIQTSKV